MDLAKYVGQDVLVAKHNVKVDFPKFEVEILPKDTVTTMEFRNDRIRIWYDEVSKLVEDVTNG